MSTEKADGKWRGSVAVVIAAPIDKVWEILGDFDGLGRNFPQIFTSGKTVQGEVNEIGSVRELGASPPGGEVVTVIEKLIALDDVKHTSTYSIIGGNLGLVGYESTISCEKIDEEQTRAAWSYEVEPTGQPEEAYKAHQLGFYSSILGLVGPNLSK